jgi:hypothetical protein
MSRNVADAIVIIPTSNTDREGTFYRVTLSSGSAIIQTAWSSGAVLDNVFILGIRTNSGNLGFIGQANAIGPPPNDFNQQITSTNPSDSSGINVLILTANPTQHRGFPITQTAGILSLRGNGNNNGNFGTATLSGGSVTINTLDALSSNTIFCCNGTTPLIGPNTPNPVGNVWISNVVVGNSFTITSTEPTASNPVFWFILPQPQTQGDSLAHANVILDSSATASNNFGVMNLTAGAASIHRPQVTPTSVVYVNTITPDPNPSNRGFMLVAPDSTNGNIDFWSTNSADTQKFAWWLMETAGGVT